MTDQWEQAYREMEGCWELATAQVEYLTKRVRELEEGLERLVVGVTRYFNGEPQAPGILEIRDEARRILGMEVEP